MKKLIQILFFIFFTLTLNAQVVSNVHFEQIGKQIHIYYDLNGEENYNIIIYCSEDNGNNWGSSLVNVSGDVGEPQEHGTDKLIIWEVLEERDKLSGEIGFKIEIVSSASGYFTDKSDGRRYKWVQVGTQVWMAENLNYKVKNSWCYDNKKSNCNKYGRLYNWRAANISCPSGWHLPTDDEWKTLEIHLGMSQSEADDTERRGTDEGKKLKSTSGWHSSGNGTDTVGFSALPGGYRDTGGKVYNLGYYGYWWSATADGSPQAWHRRLYYSDDGVVRRDNEDYGFSVRCVRD